MVIKLIYCVHKPDVRVFWEDVAVEVGILKRSEVKMLECRRCEERWREGGAVPEVAIGRIE